PQATRKTMPGGGSATWSCRRGGQRYPATRFLGEAGATVGKPTGTCCPDTEESTCGLQVRQRGDSRKNRAFWDKREGTDRKQTRRLPGPGTWIPTATPTFRPPVESRRTGDGRPPDQRRQPRHKCPDSRTAAGA